MRFLTQEQVARLDAASDTVPVYPYWHQRQFAERNPLPVVAGLTHVHGADAF